MSTVDKSKLKDAILKTLIEKGDYASVLSHISGEEKEEKGNQLTNLIKPMSAVADILTENAKGAFMEDLEKRLDDATTKSSEELRSDLENAHKELQTELKTAIDTDRESLSQEVLNRIGDAQTKLQTTLATYADSIVTAKAQSMFADLGKQAKLTDAEISEIVSSAALEVESQIVSIIGEYISEQGITVSQITDFKTEVQKLIPQVDFSNARINWGQIVGAPSQGGTNTNIVRQLIAEALASFSAGSGHTIEDEGTPLTQRDTLNFVGAGVTVTDAGGKTVVTIPGGGGAVDSVNGQTGVVVLDADDISDASTTNKFSTAGEKAKLSNITVTQAVDLDAIEAASHAAVTVTDSTSIDITLTGQGITAQREALTGAITAPKNSNTTSLGSFTKAQLDTAVSDGNILYVGDVTQYTDELAQDATGAMVANSTFINLAYNDGTPSLTPALSATGTPSSSTFLRGDNTWAVPSGGGSATKVYVTVGDATTDFPVASYTDIGDAINAAYASLPTDGGTVFIQNGTYSYTTPIVFGTNAKIASLIGASAAGTILKYTPTSGNAITINHGDVSGRHRQHEVGHFTMMGASVFVYVGTTNTRTSVGLYLGGTNGCPGISVHDMTINGFGTQIETAANFYMASVKSVSLSGGNGVNGTGTGLQGSLVHINSFSNSGERIVFSDCTFSDPCNSEADNAIYVESSGAASLIFDGCSMDNAQLRILGTTMTTFTNGHIENPTFATYGEYTPIYLDEYEFGTFVFTNNAVVDASNDAAKNFSRIIFHGVNLIAIGNHIYNVAGQTIARLFDNTLYYQSSSEYIAGTVVEGGTVTEITWGWSYTPAKGMAAHINFQGSYGTGLVANADDTYNWKVGSDVNALTSDVNGRITAIGDIVVADEAYDATAWNGSLEVPTKNAIRDKIESISAGSGITRTVVVTSGSATMGSSASTDYVYFVVGAHTMSMPAASGNTNRYTIKNNHSAAITVDTVGAETIDGTASIQIAPEDSVDIISDGTNYFVV